MTDYYVSLLEVTRKYLGSAAPRFVKAVLQHLGASPLNLTEEDVRNFAEEIEAAAGKSLSRETKENFKESVLRLIEGMKVTPEMLLKAGMIQRD